MMNIQNLEVGKLYKEGVTRYSEGAILTVTNAGLNLDVYFNRPTDSEIASFKSDTPYKIGLFKKDGVLFFLFKPGNLQWMDSPYCVGLESNMDLINLEQISDTTTGYALNVALIDASTGILKSYRLIGLQNRFSKTFKTEFDKQKELGAIDRNVYSVKLNNIFNTYNTKDMVRNALVSYSAN